MQFCPLHADSLTTLPSETLFIHHGIHGMMHLIGLAFRNKSLHNQDTDLPTVATGEHIHEWNHQKISVFDRRIQVLILD
jgi:hypothetical protein